MAQTTRLACLPRTSGARAPNVVVAAAVLATVVGGGGRVWMCRDGGRGGRGGRTRGRVWEPE
jgi:hypothetical protein